MDSYSRNPAILNKAALQALDAVGRLCAVTRTDSDLENLVLSIDRHLRDLRFDFVSLTLHRLVEEDQHLFESHLITASTESSRTTQQREGVYRDWEAGKVIYRRDLDRALEGLPPESLKNREANIGVSVKSTVNIPFSRGTFVIRSERPHAFDDFQIEFLLRLAYKLALAPVFQTA